MKTSARRSQPKRGVAHLGGDAVVRVRAVVRALPVDAHLEQLVDGGVHGAVVGAQHAFDDLVVHGGEHGLEVLHGLVELQAPDLPVGPAVVQLPALSAAAPGASIAAAAAPEQAGHPPAWSPTGRLSVTVSNRSPVGLACLVLPSPLSFSSSSQNASASWSLAKLESPSHCRVVQHGRTRGS